MDKSDFEICLPMPCFGKRHGVYFLFRSWDWKPIRFQSQCDILGSFCNIPCLDASKILLEKLTNGEFYDRVVFMLDLVFVDGRNYLPDTVETIALEVKKCRNPDLATVLFREFLSSMIRLRRADTKIVESIIALISFGIQMGPSDGFSESCIRAVSSFSNYLPLTKELLMGIARRVVGSHVGNSIVGDILKSIPRYYFDGENV